MENGVEIAGSNGSAEDAQAPRTGGGARIVGEVVVRPLKLKVNGWNPNQMSPATRESLKFGMMTDGWLSSQALLVWGTDDAGNTKDVVIDGEHRLLVARELGMKTGPMVFLNGITEAEAKRLTVKMNQKRGHWDGAKLEDLLRDLESSGEELSALDLGFGEEELLKLLAVPPEEPPQAPDHPSAGESATEGSDGAAPNTSNGAVTLPPAQTRMVQLYLDEVTQPSFMADCTKLGPFLGTKTVTDTVLEAVRRAAAALDASSEATSGPTVQE